MVATMLGQVPSVCTPCFKPMASISSSCFLEGNPQGNLFLIAGMCTAGPGKTAIGETPGLCAEVSGCTPDDDMPNMKDDMT
jgi:hypothetical protein